MLYLIMFFLLFGIGNYYLIRSANGFVKEYRESGLDLWIGLGMYALSGILLYIFLETQSLIEINLI